MRLGTLRTGETTTAVRIYEDRVQALDGFADLGALLAESDWASLAQTTTGTSTPLDNLGTLDWAPVIPRPGKVLCVGLNYRSHILEMGRPLPAHPTLFSKYPEALIGASDPIVLPPAAAGQMDWEGELAVIIGHRVRHAGADEAQQSIAGYSIINDVTARDYQYRTTQWLQGKTFEATSPFGPVMVTADEYHPGSQLRTVVNDEEVQRSSTGDLVFSAAELVSYISHILTLQPGDVIATGTPGGVGHARDPKRYLAAGDVLTTEIVGIGELRNDVRVD